MPRKMRPGKSRRTTGWELESLDELRDVLTLQSGCIHHNPFYPRVRIRTLEDARQAWEANRHLLMQMCTCHKDKPRCPDHELKYPPGTRPWAYWRFDLNYGGTPRNERSELERLGLITEPERRAMAIKPETAEVIEFPGAADDGETDDDL